MKRKSKKPLTKRMREIREKINKEERIISSQIPSGGISINAGSTVSVTLE